MNLIWLWKHLLHNSYSLTTTQNISDHIILMDISETQRQQQQALSFLTAKLNCQTSQHLVNLASGTAATNHLPVEGLSIATASMAKRTSSSLAACTHCLKPTAAIPAWKIARTTGSAIAFPAKSVRNDSVKFSFNRTWTWPLAFNFSSKGMIG